MIRRRSHRLWWAALLLVTTACTPPGLPAPIDPTSSSAVPSGSTPEAALVIGLDSTPTGFNPHAIADYSPTTTAVSSLVLPSVSSTASDGMVSLDKDLVDSAVVTSTAPFTITYKLDRDAAWSDGTPITAEDFSYLWQQMLVQPGTIDPAGYRSISAIRSKDAGKTVEVQFSEPVQDWIGLFSPLLPSHLLKDSPGGWSDGLASGIAVSGNRYKMVDYDTTTGEITLDRNDKYWGSQPGPASVVLRIGSPGGLVAALQRGDIRAALISPDTAAAGELDKVVPAERRVQVALPATVQLVFNTQVGPTAAVEVRRAIAAGLDLASIRTELGGGDPGAARPVTSQLSLPGNDAGAPPVTTDDAAAAAVDLAAAGYSRTGVYFAKSGQPLRLTLAFPAGSERFATMAGTVQASLGAIGIEVDLVKLDNRTLVVDRLAAGTAQLALVMVPRVQRDAVAAASAFSCAPVPATTPPAPRTGNLSGFCDAGVGSWLTNALTGAPASGQTVDTRLWADLPVLPVAQPTELLVVAPSLASVISTGGPGWTFSGPLAGLPGWPAG